MEKELQRILDMPYSKLIPQIVDNSEYYDESISIYEKILKMADREITKSGETKEMTELKETMNRYIISAEFQKKCLMTSGQDCLLSNNNS